MSIRDMPIDHDTRISEALIEVDLQSPGVATYTFSYSIVGTESCKPHDNYWHIVPNRIVEIHELRAWDEHGGLETIGKEFDAKGNIKTEFQIKYRELMEPGRSVKIGFSFKAAPAVINASAAFRSILFYSDYLSYTIECESLRYTILPPKGFIFYKISKSHLSPVVDQGGVNPHVRPIVPRFRAISPRIPVPVQFALRSAKPVDPRRAAPAVFALLSIYGGATAGSIFDQGVVWILISTGLVGIVLLMYFLLSIGRK